jgi:hypothetical protein
MLCVCVCVCVCSPLCFLLYLLHILSHLSFNFLPIHRYDEDMLELLVATVNDDLLRETEDGVLLDVEALGSFLSGDGTYSELDASNGSPDLMELFIEELTGILSNEPLFNPPAEPIAFIDELDFQVQTALPLDGSTQLTPDQVAVLEDAMVDAFTSAVIRSPEYTPEELQMIDATVEGTTLTPSADGMVLDVESLDSFLSNDGTYSDLMMGLGDPTLLALFIE